MRSTSLDLFGEKHINSYAIHDLPSKIDLLLSNTTLHRVFTSEEIIREHTLYNYYSSFIGEKRRVLLLKSMCSENGGAIKSGLGLIGKSQCNAKILRMCPSCVEQDSVEYGEPFWHLEHQAPLVNVCSKHSMLLMHCCPKCQMDFTVDKYKYRYLREDCESGHSFIGQGIDMKTNILWPHHLNYSDDVSNILFASQNYEPEDLFLIYKAGLHKLGFLTKANYVRLLALTESFLDYYGERYLKYLGCAIQYSQNNWLVRMFRKPAHLASPINHILVIRFLFGSVKDFLSINWKVYKDFGAIRKISNKVRVVTDNVDYKDYCREVILSIQSTDRQYLRADIIRMAQKEYSWLRRNDCQWLENNLPPALSTSQFLKTKVDWYEMDMKFSYIVEVSAQEIKLRDKPQRVTLAKIITSNKELKGLKDKLRHLPQTSDILSKLLESTEDFQIRRLRRIANRLRSNGDVITESKLKAASGLYRVNNERISLAIKEEISIN